MNTTRDDEQYFLEVSCPKCGVRDGVDCKGYRGTPRKTVHIERMRYYEECGYLPFAFDKVYAFLFGGYR